MQQEKKENRKFMKDRLQIKVTPNYLASAKEVIEAEEETGRESRVGIEIEDSETSKSDMNSLGSGGSNQDIIDDLSRNDPKSQSHNPKVRKIKAVDLAEG